MKIRKCIIRSKEMMPKHKKYCAECCAIFNDWETIYSWDEGHETVYLCEDCFDAKFDELSRIEKAQLVGSRAVFVANEKPFRLI